MEDKICPNCGRYVGSLEVCPYCGTKIPKHTAYYYVKYGSVAFAVIGIIFLLIFAQSAPVQYVHIGDITQTYNYGTVEIRGVVASAPSLLIYKEGSATLYFDVDDGTGIMSVHVYSPTVWNLQKAGKVPCFGCFVKVVGEVYFRGDNRYMILNSPDQITIERPRATEMSAAEINSIEYPHGMYVWVEMESKVLSVYKTTSGSYVMNVTDGTGYVDVYIPFSIVNLTSGVNPEELEGKEIIVVGALEWYGSDMSGYWEIIPGSLGDIRVVS